MQIFKGRVSCQWLHFQDVFNIHKNKNIIYTIALKLLLFFYYLWLLTTMHNIFFLVSEKYALLMVKILLLKISFSAAFRSLFTKFLTPELTHKSYNSLDDWLDWLIPINHQTDYIIRRLTWEFKVWRIRT